mgnify:CR=1 FL=1
MAGNQNWETPPELFHLLNEEFHFKVDVAASATNTKAQHYISIEENALNPEISWTRTRADDEPRAAFCNPPYLDVLPWVVKAKKEIVQSSHGGVACILGLTVSSPLWWLYCCEYADEIRLMSPRVNFYDADRGAKSANNRDNSLIVFRNPRINPTCLIKPWVWKG